jgi:predicted RNase H-like nuclease
MSASGLLVFVACSCSCVHAQATRVAVYGSNATGYLLLPSSRGSIGHFSLASRYRSGELRYC